MSYVFSFQISGIPTIMPNARVHWAVKAKHNKLWKQYVLYAVGAEKPAIPLKRSRLILTRCSSVEPDPDNLAASFKPIIDGLRDAGVIENDRSCNVEIQYKWRKSAQKQGLVIVTVEELPCE